MAGEAWGASPERPHTSAEHPLVSRLSGCGIQAICDDYFDLACSAAAMSCCAAIFFGVKARLGSLDGFKLDNNMTREVGWSFHDFNCSAPAQDLATELVKNDRYLFCIFIISYRIYNLITCNQIGGHRHNLSLFAYKFEHYNCGDKLELRYQFRNYLPVYRNSASIRQAQPSGAGSPPSRG
jgi:hypothetical protein